MIDRDLFVGCVAILAGSLVFLGGASGHGRMMQGTVPQFLVFQFGPIVARAVVAIIGAAIVATGLFVLRGGTQSASGIGHAAVSIRHDRSNLDLAEWNRVDEPEC